MEKISVLFLLLFLGACAINPDNGFFLRNNTVPAEATVKLQDTSAAPTKVGKACTSNVLGLFSTGDRSTDAAKFNGNITQVVSVNEEFFRFLSFYASACTIVRGN